MTIVVVLLGLLGIVAAVIGYLQGHQDKGSPPTGKTPPAECRLSEQTLNRARTTNPGYFTESSSGDETYSRCDWTQTRGRDGVGTRSLGFQIHRYTGPSADHDVETGFTTAKAKPHAVQPAQTEEATGIGDEAAYQVAVGDGGDTSVTLVARKGAMVIEVTYRGTDQGLFWAKPMTAAEGREVTRLVAQELLARP